MFDNSVVETKVEPDEAVKTEQITEAVDTDPQELLIECKICGIRLNKEMLYYHMGRHSEKTEKCEYCEKLFKYPHQKLSHIQKVHETVPSKDITVMCEICGRLLLSKYTLVSHKRIVHGFDTEIDMEKFVCEKCGKCFRFETSLNNHLKTKLHNEDTWSENPVKRRKPYIRRSYKCPVCQKIITSKASFDVHARIHTGEKPFSCPACPKRFRVKGHLATHSVVHTKEKPYTCKICSKSYTQRGPLRDHIKKTHPPEKNDNEN